MGLEPKFLGVSQLLSVNVTTPAVGHPAGTPLEVIPDELSATTTSGWFEAVSPVQGDR